MMWNEPILMLLQGWFLDKATCTTTCIKVVKTATTLWNVTENLHSSLLRNWEVWQLGWQQGILGSVKFTSATNTMRHLCLSMEKPLLAVFKIHNLIISRITSKKPQNDPLSSLKFCSHCRASQKYPLPAADTCFMNPEMELHQQSWSKKTSSRSSWSLLFLLSFGAAVHRLTGASSSSKASQYYQGWRRKTEAVRQQDVKYVLKRDSTFGSASPRGSVISTQTCTSVLRGTAFSVCVYI